MSNLIKAYTIKYDEKEKKLIDLNEKAEIFQKIFFDQYKEQQRMENLLESSDDDTEDKDEADFVEGISAIAVERSEEEAADSKLVSLEDLEEIRREEKQKLQEEMESITNDAREEAKRILTNAQVEAEQIKAEAFESAKKDGYNQGKLEAEKEIAQKKADLEREKERMDLEHESLMKNIEPEFVELMISYLKKLTGYAMEEKRDIIVYLVEQALSGAENSNSYIIKVSKYDYEVVSSRKKDILWSLKEGVELEIVEDKLLSRAQCLIETDSRVIDCSLDVQLRNLIGDLRLLAGITTEFS